MKKLLVLFCGVFLCLFLNAQDEDCRWEGFGGGCGLTGAFPYNVTKVKDLVVLEDEIYIGGSFVNAGNIIANNIAKWDGTSWSSLGNGIPTGQITSLLANGTELYVGGDFYFTNADNTDIKNIVKWDGNNWTALGNGVAGGVRAMAMVGSDLYVASTLIGSIFQPNTNYLSKWDGTTWTYNIIEERISSMTVIENNLYVAGIQSIEGITVNGIAKWDGVVWSSLDGGLGDNGYIKDLTVINNNLYVGGGFEEIGGITARNVAKWDGNSWSSLGEIAGVEVSGFSTSNDILYAIINNSNGYLVNKWDGNSWEEIGINIDNFFGGINKLLFFNDDIYFGGEFKKVDDLFVDHIVKWNGTSFQTICDINDLNTTNGPISAFTKIGSEIYISGAFTSVAGVEANGIAKWNGTKWLDFEVELGKFEGFNFITGLAKNGNNLFVSGKFSSVNGVSTLNIAKWDGITWSAVGDGVRSGRIGKITIVNNDLYALGSFYFLINGQLEFKQLAKWDGINWTFVEGINGSILEVIGVGDELYVAGMFSMVGEVAANNIAKWDGENWSALGIGTNYSVRTIAAKDNIIYVAGGFSKAGGIPARGIAKWDGNSWQAMGNGLVNISDFSPIINDLEIFDNNLYAGGLFEKVEGVTGKNIAKWDGISWSGIGTGLNQEVSLLATDNVNLYLGGKFSTSGGKVSNYFAKFSPDCGVSCPQNLTLSNTITGEFHATNTIETDGNISLTAATILKAGTSITLNPGFQTNGFELMAKIEACPEGLLEEAASNRNTEILSIPITNEIDSRENQLLVYPNPFNYFTTIEYKVVAAGLVDISLFDISGRKVEQLASSYKEKGSYQIELSANQLSSGLYFLHARLSNEIKVQKIYLQK